MSGNALVILGGPYHLIQTIYLDDVQSLDGVEIDESTGKIAVSSGSSIYVYQPYGKSEGALKVASKPGFEDRILTISSGLFNGTQL